MHTSTLMAFVACSSSRGHQESGQSDTIKVRICWQDTRRAIRKRSEREQRGRATANQAIGGRVYHAGGRAGQRAALARGGGVVDLCRLPPRTGVAGATGRLTLGRSRTQTGGCEPAVRALQPAAQARPLSGGRSPDRRPAPRPGEARSMRSFSKRAWPVSTWRNVRAARWILPGWPTWSSYWRFMRATSWTASICGRDGGSRSGRR